MDIPETRKKKNRPAFISGRLKFVGKADERNCFIGAYSKSVLEWSLV